MNEKRASAIAQPEQEEASFPRSLSPGNGGTTWTDEQNRNLFQWNLDRNCRKLKKAELKSKQSVSRWSQVWKNQQRTLKLRRVTSISEHPYSLQKHFNTLQTILNLRRVLKTLIKPFLIDSTLLSLLEIVCDLLDWWLNVATWHQKYQLIERIISLILT